MTSASKDSALLEALALILAEGDVDGQRAGGDRSGGVLRLPRRPASDPEAKAIVVGRMKSAGGPGAFVASNTN
jgi:hypothetical protein